MLPLRVLLLVGLALSTALLPAAAQQKEQSIVIINGSDTPIEYVYLAACDAGDWGKDRLRTKEIIEPGARRTFKARITGGNCCHDMRAKMYTGASFQKLAVDICREPEWTVR